MTVNLIIVYDSIDYDDSESELRSNYVDHWLKKLKHGIKLDEINIIYIGWKTLYTLGEKHYSVCEDELNHNAKWLQNRQI